MKTPLYYLVFAALIGLSPVVLGNAMRESVYNALETAKGLIEEGRFTTAGRQLDKIGQRDKLSNYERSQVLNLSGYLAIQQNDYRAAIHHYQAILSLEEVPDGLHRSTQRNLVQLHYQNGDWQQALNVLGEMGPDNVEDDRQLTMLRAHSLYQLGRYRQSADTLENHGVDNVSEQALNLLRACYQQLNDYDGAVHVLEILTERFPKTDYLKSLASLYGLQGNYRHQLALLESLYSNQLLESETEWRALVSLHLHHNQPHKAALRLREAMDLVVIPDSDKNQFKLARAWIQAHEPEHALRVLEGLSNRTSDGKSELMAGRLLLQNHEWSRAASWLEKAFAKSGSTTPEISLLLGVAEMRSGNHSKARKALKRAAEPPSTQQRARQWLSYMDQTSTSDVVAGK